MSELDAELGTTEEVASETLEQALARHWSGSAESAEARPQAESDDVSADVQADSEVEESDSDALQPLEKWNDETKSMFRSLPREAQQFLLDRNRDVESHLTKRSQEISEHQKRYERLDEVLKPYDSLAKQNGVDLTPHVAQALQYYFAFQRDPSGTLRALAQNANVDLDQMAIRDEEVDPAIRSLRTELQQAKQEIAELRGQSTSSAESQVRAFQSAANDDGSLKYPHFDALREQMAPLVAKGKSLEEAYESVLWTLPDYRQQQLEKQQQQAIKELEAKRSKKAREARTKSTLPPSDVDAGTSLKTVNGNWAEALKHTLSKME